MNQHDFIHGLYIGPEWASAIRGRLKTAEIRGTALAGDKLNRWIPIIATGTGRANIAVKFASSQIVARDDLKIYFAQHQVDAKTIAELDYKTPHLWYISDVATFTAPISIPPIQGSVIWQNLTSPQTVECINRFPPSVPGVPAVPGVPVPERKGVAMDVGDDSKEAPANCPICYQPMVSAFVRLTCTHSLHRSCAEQWRVVREGVNQPFSCPLCRADAPIPSIGCPKPEGAMRLKHDLDTLTRWAGLCCDYPEANLQKIEPTSFDRAIYRKDIIGSRKELKETRAKLTMQLSQWFATTRLRVHSDSIRISKKLKELAYTNFLIRVQPEEAAELGFRLDSD